MNQQQKPSGLTGPKPEPSLATIRQEEVVKLTLSNLDLSQHQSPVKSGIESNLTKAIQEGAFARRASLGSSVIKSLNQFGMATVLVGMGLYNTSQISLSFTAHPFISSFIVVSFLTGVASALHGGLTTYQELKNRKQSLRADTISSTPEFDESASAKTRCRPVKSGSSNRWGGVSPVPR